MRVRPGICAAMAASQVEGVGIRLHTITKSAEMAGTRSGMIQAPTEL